MKRKLAILLVAAGAIVSPFFIMAQGLVPCGDAGETSCQFCDFAILATNITDWLVGLMSVVAAIFFVVAGMKLVTSVGNAEAKSSARTMIINVTIGYVILLGAWIAIDFGFRAFVNDTTFAGPWETIQCVQQPDLVVVMVSTSDTCDFSGGVYNCSAQQAQCASRTNSSSTVVTDGAGVQSVECDFLTGGGANPPDLSAAGACDASLVARHFPDQVGNAQCIIRDESTCGAASVSVTDVMSSDGRAFSFGPMQINLTVHELTGCGPGGTDLDCLNAFSGRNYSATVVNESLYAACAAAAQDHECNIRNGRRIYNEAGGSWRPWSTAAGCGLR